MVYGWFGLLVSIPNIRGTPYAQKWIYTAPDSDNDQLPDRLELTPKGEKVIVNGRHVGYGTGTDPFDPDTDNDLFPDNAEIKIGSDPHNWLDPGWIWILWMLFLGAVTYKLFIHKPDRLKEYRRNEMMISRGASGKKGKFAYGRKSVFGISSDDLTQEEKKKVLMEDERVLQLTGLSEEDDEEFMKRRRKEKLKQKFLKISILVVVFYLVSILI